MPNLYTDLLQMRMPSLGDLGWDDEVNDNTKITDFVLGSVLKKNMVISGCAVTDGGGLGVDVAAGFVAVGNTEFTIAAVSKTCTDAALNFIYVDDAGAVQVNTTAPTGEYCALALVDAAAAAIDRIGDCRNFLGPKVVSNNPHGNDNSIINPLFDNWQRGTSFSGSGIYTADRIRLSSSATSCTFTQVAGTTINGYIRSNFGARIDFVPNVSTSGYVNFVERIEDVNSLQDTVATVNIKANIPIGNLAAVVFTQNFGSGGSASIDAIQASSHLVGTGAETVYTVTANIPSTSGKTVGDNSFIECAVWLDAGSDFDLRNGSLGHQPAGSIYIYAMQVRPGIRDNIFEIPNKTQDLLNCYRYYSVGSRGYTGVTAAATAIALHGFYIVPMRVTPAAIVQPDLTISVHGIAEYSTTTAAVTFLRAGSQGMAYLNIAGFTGLPFIEVCSIRTGSIGMDAEL